jgi:Sec-independent protein translocase protein TatA
LLLVVVGPERLPGRARQAGTMLVRARNWLQSSPDAALVLRARQELEAELASIRTSLMEVQNVRDEVLGAAKQLEESVSSIASSTKDEMLGAAKQIEESVNSIASTAKTDLKDPANSTSDQTIAPNTQAAPNQTESLAVPDGSPADQPAADELPNPTSVPLSQPAEAQALNGTAPAAAPALAELESINVRLQAIMSDLWALQEQLKQRGSLDPSWQPPSWHMRLPEPESPPPDGNAGTSSTTPPLALGYYNSPPGESVPNAAEAIATEEDA